MERGRNHFGGQKNYLLLYIYSQVGIELTQLCCFLRSIFCGIWGSEILVADKSQASLAQRCVNCGGLTMKALKNYENTQWRVDHIIE